MKLTQKLRQPIVVRLCNVNRININKFLVEMDMDILAKIFLLELNNYYLNGSLLSK